MVESGYSPVVEELEDVEGEIRDYQEFLGALRETYVDCGDGCTESKGAGRMIDPDYLLDLYEDFSFEDDFLEQELSQAENVQARRVRRFTVHCRELLAEKRETREELRDTRRRLEEQIAFSRHPKKESVRQ